MRDLFEKIAEISFHRRDVNKRYIQNEIPRREYLDMLASLKRQEEWLKQESRSYPTLKVVQ